MSKVRTVTGGGQIFWCPGCDEPHAVNTRPNGPRWSYNGNQAAPTFSPSIKVTCDWGDPPHHEVCHSFVTDGRIQFLGDCTHKLAGQTVPLPDWPYARGDYGGVED